MTFAHGVFFFLFLHRLDTSKLVCIHCGYTKTTTTTKTFTAASLNEAFHSPVLYFDLCLACTPHKTPSSCRHTHPLAPWCILPPSRVNIAGLYLCWESIRQSVSLFPTKREGETESSSKSCDLWSVLVRKWHQVTCMNGYRERGVGGLAAHQRLSYDVPNNITKLLNTSLCLLWC